VRGRPVHRRQLPRPRRRAPFQNNAGDALLWLYAPGSGSRTLMRTPYTFTAASSGVHFVEVESQTRGTARYVLRVQPE